MAFLIVYVTVFYVENCSFLGHYADISGNFLPTFRGNLSVPFAVFRNPKETP